MTRAMWTLAGIILALVALTVAIIVWRRPHVDSLPPVLVTAVDHEKADRARVDSQLIAATLEAYAAQQRQARAEAKADSIRAVARKLSVYADSLARTASIATTAKDSALYYREAYEVRTDERDTLLAALTAKDTALDAAHDRIAALTRAAGIADTARQRADSVLDAVVHSVTVCTVPGTFGRVKCPSRRTALIVGIAAGAALPSVVRAVRDGRIRIPLLFIR